MALKLSKKENLSLTVWINGSIFADKKWEVLGANKDNEVYIHLKDPNSKNTMKIKIVQNSEYEEINETKSIDTESVVEDK